MGMWVKRGWEYSPVDTATMTAEVCTKTTRAVPVDTHMNALYVHVSGTDDTSKPTLQLVDANGERLGLPSP